MEIIGNEYLMVVLVPILVGILQVVKKTELVDMKFIPVVSIVVGLLLGIFFSGYQLKEGIIAGLIIGLSAVGLFSGTKNVIEGIGKVTNK